MQHCSKAPRQWKCNLTKSIRPKIRISCSSSFCKDMRSITFAAWRQQQASAHQPEHRRVLLAAARWLSGCRTKATSAAGEVTTSGSVQPEAAAVAGTQQLLLHLPPCQAQDIIEAVTADGQQMYLEVVAAGDGDDRTTVQLAHQGVIYAAVQAGAASADSGPLQLQPQGWQLHPEHDLVKALPGWAAALQQQQSKQQLPSQALQLQSAAVVYSAAQLQAAVKANPAPWRDGTGPLDPPLQGLQYQTLCAGELEALLCRARGVVMVQLSVGWDAAAPQPVSNLLVLQSLRRALGSRDLTIFMSPAAGGLGLTAILAGKADPFRPWAAHLASFGAQAALVADSPYYKLLIGRVLGYKEENIRFHIQATSGRQHPVPEVVAAVDKDLAKLSKKKPVLPWKPDSSSSSSNKAGNSRQRQQQARSERKRR